jgi:MFS family permease
LTVLPAPDGLIGDLRYGRRLVFVGGVAIFSAASLLCGVATSAGWLDSARALQGFGAAALFATALALIGAEYSGPARAGAIAVCGSTIGLAVAAGPLLGGVITDSIGWRWIFFVNRADRRCGAGGGGGQVRESRDPNARRADVAGLVTVSSSLILVVFALLRASDVGWSSAQIGGAFAGGFALLAVSSSGLRAAHGSPVLVDAANAAFVGGFRLLALISFGILVVGVLAATLVRERRKEPSALATTPAAGKASGM